MIAGIWFPALVLPAAAVVADRYSKMRRCPAPAWRRCCMSLALPAAFILSILEFGWTEDEYQSCKQQVKDSTVVRGLDCVYPWRNKGRVLDLLDALLAWTRPGLTAGPFLPAGLAAIPSAGSRRPSASHHESRPGTNLQVPFRFRTCVGEGSCWPGTQTVEASPRPRESFTRFLDNCSAQE